MRHLALAAALLLGACDHAPRGGCVDADVAVGDACVNALVWYALMSLPALLGLWTTWRFFDFMRVVERELRSISDRLEKRDRRD